MVQFLNPKRPRLLEELVAAREHELEREDFREDLVSFVSHIIVTEASGDRIMGLPVYERHSIGTLLAIFAAKYGNPVVVRKAVDFIAASMPGEEWVLPRPVKGVTF